jgi:LacI family transcriptional regulator
VHVSTVSRTFSAPGLVNAETRSRVLAAAEQLGYRPNRAARALITGRTTNLGVIVADITNPYFPPMIKAAQSQARLHDHHVFVADTDEDPAVEEELVRTLATQVDGLLLCSPRMSGPALEAVAGEVPIVLVNRIVEGIPAVLMDLDAGARQAIDHLADLGHEQLAYVGGPATSWTNKELRRASVSAAKHRGVRLTHLGPFPPNQVGGQTAAPAVRTSGATGVFAFNDSVAIGLMETLRAEGVAVPEQISIVGVDDIPQAELVRLTTVATPTDEAGRTAVEMLLQRDSGRGSRGGAATRAPVAGHRSLPTSLVVRASTAPPPPTTPAPRSGGRSRARAHDTDRRAGDDLTARV